MKTDETYMRRALQLALNGAGGASPNPMVGAVIVAPDGEIIGEGWHRVRGLGHAEVNAVASVPDDKKPMLRKATMYVTLEPCSHYGKTPPCAELIVRTGIPRVVVATGDPNPKVAGRGIAMLRREGVEVVVGCLEEEARRLNRCFMLSQTQRRPWITLKWAATADGFMARQMPTGVLAPVKISNNAIAMSTMRLRSQHDAILTTAATAIADECSLTVRGWYGRQPRRFVVDRGALLPSDHPLFKPVDRETSLLSINGHEADLVGLGPAMIIEESDDLHVMFSRLYSEYGVTSILVETGPTFLKELISRGLWDDAREEIAPDMNLGLQGACLAPCLPGRLIWQTSMVQGHRLNWYCKYQK